MREGGEGSLSVECSEMASQGREHLNRALSDEKEPATQSRERPPRQNFLV